MLKHCPPSKALLGIVISRAVTLRWRIDCTIDTFRKRKDGIDFESDIFNSLFDILYNTAYARQLCFLLPIGSLRALRTGSLSGVCLSGET